VSFDVRDGMTSAGAEPVKRGMAGRSRPSNVALMLHDRCTVMGVVTSWVLPESRTASDRVAATLRAATTPPVPVGAR
jgi:hypothetical protein